MRQPWKGFVANFCDVTFHRKVAWNKQKKLIAFSEQFGLKSVASSGKLVLQSGKNQAFLNFFLSGTDFLSSFLRACVF